MPSTLKEIIAVNSTDLEIKYKDTVNVKEAGWSIIRSSKLHKFTKKFHIIKDFSLNIKIIFKSTSEFIAARGTAHHVHIETWENQIKQQLQCKKKRKRYW